VAAVRTGVEVRFVSAVGGDPEGAAIRARLSAEAIDLGDVRDWDGVTDQSFILVGPGGENCIVSTHGAAASIEPAHAAAALASLAANDILLMQGNLGLATTEHCLREARHRGARTMLNPAPIQYAYEALWPLADIVVLNEVELETLAASADPATGGRRLLARGAGLVVATLGAAGAAIVAPASDVAIPAPATQAVDTTGAGDVFCGVLAAGLAKGLGSEPACRLAVRAASLSVTRPGTQASFPTRPEVQELLAQLHRR
jgi:ribokinase